MAQKHKENRKPHEMHHIDRHKLSDAQLHEAVIADGDEAAARKISDQVCRDLGLTEKEIEALQKPLSHVSRR